MSDPKIIHSALSRTIREDGIEIRVAIYRLETTDWSLELVDATGTSTVWDDLFPTDQAALDGDENNPRRRYQDAREWRKTRCALAGRACRRLRLAVGVTSLTGQVWMDAPQHLGRMAPCSYLSTAQSIDAQ